jgi:hypothetical protein
MIETEPQATPDHPDSLRPYAGVPSVRELIEHSAIERVAPVDIMTALAFMSDLLDERNRLLEELLNSTPITRFGDSWKERVRAALAGYDQPVWNKVVDNTFKHSMRMIVAKGNHVIGDCYYGYGSLTVGRIREPGYSQRQNELCWRYTSDGEQVAKHQQPDS